MFVEKLEKMKKVLIPTDFTIESLELVEYAILNFPNTTLDIVLVAGYRLPDTRWAVANFSAKEQIHQQLHEPFRVAMRRLLLEHKNHISNLHFEVFTGINSFAFRNFMEQHEVSCALIPKGKMLHFSGNRWFDITGFIKKNITELIEIPMERGKEIPQERFSLISLFNI